MGSPRDGSSVPDDLAELREEIEALYAGPLDRFVAQRKVLHARAKEVSSEVAERVAALRKPTRTAAAVNRLRTEERSRFDDVVNSGIELRAAIGDGDPSTALAQRQESIGRALEVIDASWGPNGPTPSQRQRMANTLQAISVGIDEGAEPADARTALVLEALRGRLTSDLEPPGLEVLMGLQPGRRRRPAKPKSVKRATSTKAKRTKAGAKATKAGADAAEARRLRARKRALQKKIDASRSRCAQLETDMDDARTRVLELQAQLEEARERRATMRADLDAEVARRRKLEAELRSL